MGSQVRGHQNFVHCSTRQSELARQGSHTPATLSRRLLADAVLEFLPDLRTILARAPQAGSILEPLQAVAGKTASPFADGDLGDSQPSGDVLVGFAIGRGQDDPG